MAVGSPPAGDGAGFASLPLSLALVLEEVCNRFEAAWQQVERGGSAPRPEDYLASAPGEGRAALLRELMRIDMAYRREAAPQPLAGAEPGRLHDALTATTAPTPEMTPSLPQPREATGTGAPTLPIPGIPLSLPVRIDDYELLEEIARGGMGVVYKARQISLGRIVAVKMILAPGSIGKEAVQRFHREARAAAALDHPNIVSIYTSGQHDGRPFFAMAYVDGNTLREVVRREGLPTPQRAAEVVRTVAEAVALAHRHGIVHRDLKPENVLIDRHGRPRVTDFGLAYLADQPEAPDTGDRLTHAGQLLGTPTYMSPEQAMSRHEAIGPATDIYSLGGILYFLLTGQPPFQGRYAAEVLCRVVTEAPRPPREINPQLPAALEAVCLRCLEKDPASRYPSAEALAAALSAAVTQPEISATEPMLPIVEKPPRSRRTWLAVAAVILLGIAAGVLLAIWNPWQVGPATQPSGGALDPPTDLRHAFGLKVDMLRELPGGNLELLREGEDGLIRLRDGDTVRFQIQVAEEAWVAVLSVNAGGPAVLLFPNDEEPNHHFAKGEERVVPRSTLEVPKAVKSAGKEWVWVQALTRDWKPQKGDHEGLFQVFRSEREREDVLLRQRGIEWRRNGGELAEAVLQYWVDPK
jgi:serine/threonine protein kinase